MNTIKRLIKKYMLFSMLVLPLQLIYADDWKELVDLSGYWKFNIGDDKEWSKYEYNDDSWEEIEVPSSWENEGYHGYNGYAWYRKQFSIPDRINNNSIYISLGYVDDVDEVYLNGHLIGFSGSFPPKYRSAHSALRKYPVSSDLFNFGEENVIAVRVYDSQQFGGIVKGDISIMSLESVNLKVNFNGFWKFQIGDNLAWKEENFIDDKWDSLLVPSYWELHGYPDHNGFAWYRKKFSVNMMLKNEKLMVLLGKIDDIDQCFLNGEMIGSTGDFISTPETNNVGKEWSELRAYYIPENLLRYGEDNVISVRVYDGYQVGGIYQGPIGITTQDEYRNYWKRKKSKKNIWESIFKTN